MRICHSWRPLAKYEEAKIGLLEAFAVLNRNNKLCTSLTANSFVPGAFGDLKKVSQTSTYSESTYRILANSFRDLYSVIGQKTQFHAFVNNKWKGIIIMTTTEFHACHI